MRMPRTGRAIGRSAEQTSRLARPKHMVRVPGGTFLMGSDHFNPEERPVHPVTVDGFWIDEHPVTNGEFRRFVQATGYVTVSERPLDPGEYPDADPLQLVPGSLVFRRTTGPRSSRRLVAVVAVRGGCLLAPPGGRGQHGARPRPSSSGC